MDWNTLLTALLGLLGGGGGLLALIKAGLLKISIGKNGNGNGNHDILDVLHTIEGNHLHTLQATLNEVRKDQNERADKIISLLEEAQKSHLETLIIVRKLEK